MLHFTFRESYLCHNDGKHRRLSHGKHAAGSYIFEPCILSPGNNCRIKNTSRTLGSVNCLGDRVKSKDSTRNGRERSVSPALRRQLNSESTHGRVCKTSRCSTSRFRESYLCHNDGKYRRFAARYCVVCASTPLLSNTSSFRISTGVDSDTRIQPDIAPSCIEPGLFAFAHLAAFAYEEVAAKL